MSQIKVIIEILLPVFISVVGPKLVDKIKGTNQVSCNQKCGEIFLITNFSEFVIPILSAE